MTKTHRSPLSGIKVAVGDDWAPHPHIINYVQSWGCNFEELNGAFITSSNDPKEYCDVMILYCDVASRYEPSNATIIKHLQILEHTIPVILYVPWDDGKLNVLGQLSAEINPDDQKFKVEKLPNVFLLREPITRREVKRILCLSLGIKEEKIAKNPRENSLSSTQRLDIIRNRLETLAAGLSALRINSADSVICEIRALSEECEVLKDRDGDKGFSKITTVTPETVARRTLLLLSTIFDLVGSKRGAEMIVAGAVAGIVSLGGWPAASIYGLSMAAWMGKDAFMKSIKLFSEKK